MNSLKKTLCMLLTLILALGAFPSVPLADTGEEPAISISELIAETRSLGTYEEWIELQTEIDNAASGDTITLTQAITAGSGNGRLEIPYGKTITLDLNGYTLDRAYEGSASDTGSVIYISGSAKLTVKDSSPEKTGVITGGFATQGGGVYISKSGTLNLESGTISGNRAANNGGGVYVDNGSTLNMTGGSISGNSADRGGGIYLKALSFAGRSTFNMSGGTVENNTAEDRGGGISNNGIVNLTGGKIRGNYAPKGGGLDCTTDCDHINVSGSPVVEGNVNGNLYIDGNVVIDVVGELTGEARLDVEGANMPRNITSGFGESGSPLSAFTFLYGGTYLTLTDGELVPNVGGSVTVSTWDELKAALQNDAANVALANDITNTNRDTSIHITSGQYVTLDLMGHYIDVNRSDESSIDDGHFAFINNDSSLKVMDSVGTGYITGGNATNGGAFHVKGDSYLKLYNVTLKNNKAARGGAINVDGATLAVYGSVIDECEATNNAGGIYVTGSSNLRLYSSAIINTVTASDGGGLDIQGLKNDSSEIDNCRITGNTVGSSKKGGGFRLNASGRTLDINETIIENNTAGGQGGGIYIDQGTVHVTGGSISGNSSGAEGGGIYCSGGDTIELSRVTLNNNVSQGDGGALDVMGTASVLNCEFIGNESKDRGGAVYIHGSTASITGAVIKNNSAVNHGGGIYHDQNPLYLSDVTVTDNVAYHDGGGIYHESGDENLKLSGKIVVKDNSAQNGKNIYLPDDKLLVIVSPGLDPESEIGVAAEKGNRKITKGYSDYHSSVDPNTFFLPDEDISFTLEGGEVKLINTSWPQLQTILSDAQNGETVVLDMDWTAKLSSDTHLIVDGGKSITLDLAGHTIDRNCASADSNGEVITVRAYSMLTIIDSVGGGKITGGFGTYGGGIYVNANAVLSLQGGEISGNKASHCGAGIYSHGTVYVSGGTISGNTITGSDEGDCGGGIWCDSILEITGGTISGNYAGYDGGGVYTEGRTTISGGLFTENTARLSGGAVRIQGGTTTVSGGTFESNEATVYHGGAIYLGGTSANYGTLNLEGGVYRNNTAGMQGGAILFGNAPYVTLNVKGSPIIENNNYAPYGNGLFLRGSNKLTVAGALTSSAKLDLAAAAIDRELTTGLPGNGQLSNFSYNGSAGAVELSSNGEVFIKRITGDVMVSSWDELQAALNDTGNDGKTVVLSNALDGTGKECLTLSGSGRNVTVELAGFAVNMNRTSSGGSKHVFEAMDGATLTIQDTYGTGSITGGWCDGDGGGVYVNTDSAVILNGVSVVNNKVESDGGGVYVKGTFIMNGGEIVSNTSDDNGGAVYSEGTGKVTLDGVRIADNTSKNSGGGLYLHVKDDTSTIKNCTITGNISRTGSGGGLYFNQSGRELTLENNIISNNTCDDSGGAIFVNAGKVIITGTEGLISGNIAEKDSGGGIFSNDKLTIQGGTISENYAEKDGGGVYSKGTTAITGGTIENNTAHKSGGGMRVKGGTTSIGGGTISENKADESGGGIYLNNSCTFIMSGGSITENDALLDGGGVLVGDSVTAVKLSGNAAIFGNTASKGYDVYVRDDLRLTVAGAFGIEANIGVSFHDFGSGDKFTEEYGAYNPSAAPSVYFFSNDGYDVVLKDGEAALRIATDTGDQFIPRNEQIETNVNRLSPMNWMSGVSGERRLNEINLPGSHDAGMRSIYHWTQTAGDIAAAYVKYAYTQRQYIDEQLESGIRKLDIRLNNRHVTKGALIPFIRRLTDDGENLWITHGKDFWAGTFFAKDRDGGGLSLAKVVNYVKEFLKNHPSEIVILDFSPEILNGDPAEFTRIVETRLEQVLRELSTDINPSTNKPYLYMQDGVFGTKMTCYPKLKDCRGQIIANYQGGYSWIADGNVTEYAAEGETKESAPSRIQRVYDFFFRYGMPDLPTNAQEHYDFIYHQKTNSTNQTADTPLELVDKIHPVLYGEGKIYDPTNGGKYVGFVNMDGANAKDARCVWITNFFDGLEYCSVTAKSGFNNTDLYQDQSFRLLKYTPIKIPNCIYNVDQQGSYFVGWRGSDGNLYTPGMTCVIESDITFTAEWSSNATVPVYVSWIDGNDADYLRPETLTLTINSSSELTVYSENDWTGMYTGNINTIVPVLGYGPYGQNLAVEYSYELSGSMSSGYTLKLFHNPRTPKVSTFGIVVWNDEEDADGLRPNSVALHLYKNGEVIASTTATAENDWSFCLGDGIYQEYENYERVDYTITQDPIDGYSTTFSGLTVINDHYIERTYLSVGISWIDNNSPSRPESVEVRLMADGNEADSCEITQDDYDAWTYDFDVTGLLRSAGNAAPEFGVSVDPIDGYRCEITTVADGFMIRFVAEGLPTLSGEDFLAEDIALEDEQEEETLFGYRIKVSDLPEGALIIGAAVYLDYDREELEFVRAEGAGVSEWTASESETALSLIRTGGAPTAVQNGDTVLTVWFARIGEAEEVDISFTFSEEHELTGMTYVSNEQEVTTEVCTYDGSITFNLLLGDVDCNGRVNMSDVSELVAYLMNTGSVSMKGLINADANQDGAVDILDAPAICAIVLNN